MKTDCRDYNECRLPVELCNDDCNDYEPEVHPFDCKCPDCEAERGCAKYHMMKDMGVEDND